MLTTAGALLAGFLLGSLPFSWWIGRLTSGRDLRRTGTGNPGATNVWRTAGRGHGAVAAALDAAKGAAAVAVARWMGLDDSQAVWAGVAAVLGHDYSPLLGFKGGKGGATMLGALACFIFPELLLIFCLWLAGWALLPRARFLMSLSVLSAAPLLAAAAGRVPVPPLAGLNPRPWSVTAAAAVLTGLLWLRTAPGLSLAGQRHG